LYFKKTKWGKKLDGKLKPKVKKFSNVCVWNNRFLCSRRCSFSQAKLLGQHSVQQSGKVFQPFPDRVGTQQELDLGLIDRHTDRLVCFATLQQTKAF
jgi:hypothetical protein